MAITSTILVTAGSLVTGWLLFSARDLPAGAWDGEGKQVKLAFGPLTTVVLPVVLLAIGVAVTFAASSIPNYNEAAVVATVVVGGLLGLAGVLGLFSSRAVTWIDPVGVRARGSFSAAKVMRWSEVAQVRMSSLSGAIVLIDRSDQRIRVSPMVPGFAVFREMLEDKVHHVIVETAMERLDKLKKRWSP